MSIATVTYRPPALDDVPAAAHCHLSAGGRRTPAADASRLAELLTIDRFLELWRQRHRRSCGEVAVQGQK